VGREGEKMPKPGLEGVKRIVGGTHSLGSLSGKRLRSAGSDLRSG
jgi:hypothetical protein